MKRLLLGLLLVGGCTIREVSLTAGLDGAAPSNDLTGGTGGGGTGGGGTGGGGTGGGGTGGGGTGGGGATDGGGSSGDGGCVVFPEVCNGVDDNCNSDVDEGYDLETDPNNCNTCNHICRSDFNVPTPHALADCAARVCVTRCEFGYIDRDGVFANGCEIACTPSGPEVCDGVDNDCNDLVDTNDPGMMTVSNFCQQRGECSGTVPACMGGAWRCPYPSTVQMTGNQIIAQETLCDAKDNDCDGCIDDAFPQVGLAPAASGGSCQATARQACVDNGIGACQGDGHYFCKSDRTGIECVIEQPGASGTEVCNGVDDDCDGATDEAVNEPMVAISGGGVTGTKYIYAYEASRPDAIDNTQGVSTARACSTALRRPWTNISQPEAEAACAAAGKRLCSEVEWQRGCTTTAGTACTWSFASACTTRATNTCNTQEYDTVAGGSNDDSVLQTGFLTNCYANWGASAHIHDLTGNVKEWTIQRAANENPLRGGSYNNILEGSACNDNFLLADDNYRFPNVGFRCCADCPSNQLRCSGSCINPLTSNTHCGFCGVACVMPNTCQGGACKPPP